MKFVLALLLVACATKPTKPPPIDKLDRSCKVDTDCALTGDPSCCGTSCGRETGSAVNAKAWSKASALKAEQCKGEQCAVMCPKLPDCRDEAFAVCKAGTCEKELRKTAACEVVDPKLACTKKADCVLVTRGDDCCDRCDGTAMNATAAAIENQRLDEKCAVKLVKCPHVDCPAQGADCVEGKCVRKP